MHYWEGTTHHHEPVTACGEIRDKEPRFKDVTTTVQDVTCKKCLKSLVNLGRKAEEWLKILEERR